MRLEETRRHPGVALHVKDRHIAINEKGKYLGIIFDQRMCFKQHCEYFAGRAAKTITAIGKLLPNTSGPREGHSYLCADQFCAMRLRCGVEH